MLQLLNKVYESGGGGGGSFLESACNLLLNETKQCYAWTIVSFFESFLPTRLTRRLQRIIKKFAQHSRKSGIFGPPIPILT